MFLGFFLCCTGCDASLVAHCLPVLRIHLGAVVNCVMFSFLLFGLIVMFLDSFIGFLLTFLFVAIVA